MPFYTHPSLHGAAAALLAADATVATLRRADGAVVTAPVAELAPIAPTHWLARAGVVAPMIAPPATTTGAPVVAFDEAGVGREARAGTELVVSELEALRLALAWRQYRAAAGTVDEPRALALDPTTLLAIALLTHARCAACGGAIVVDDRFDCVYNGASTTRSWRIGPDGAVAGGAEELNEGNEVFWDDLVAYCPGCGAEEPGWPISEVRKALFAHGAVDADRAGDLARYIARQRLGLDPTDPENGAAVDAEDRDEALVDIQAELAAALEEPQRAALIGIGEAIGAIPIA